MSTITTANSDENLCSISLTGMTARPFKESPYETGWVCEDKYLKTDATQHIDLDGDPPLEIIASVMQSVIGF